MVTILSFVSFEIQKNLGVHCRSVMLNIGVI